MGIFSQIIVFEDCCGGKVATKQNNRVTEKQEIALLNYLQTCHSTYQSKNSLYPINTEECVYLARYIIPKAGTAVQLIEFAES